MPKCGSPAHCKDRTFADSLLAELLPLKRTAREAVAVYDRYCADDQTVDLSDIGARLEDVRKALRPS